MFDTVKWWQMYLGFGFTKSSRFSFSPHVFQRQNLVFKPKGYVLEINKQIVPGCISLVLPIRIVKIHNVEEPMREQRHMSNSRILGKSDHFA
jgi:hypothetical protein